MTITTAELFADSRAISSSLQSLSDLGYSTMAAAVKQRLSQVTTWRNLTAGIGAIALGVALALSWLITRALAAPLAQAIEVFGSIAAGKYDNTIELSGSDEAGQVLRSLDDMQRKLRTQIENERLVAAENARIRQALDKVSTSVVLADGQQRIIYLNDTAQRRLRAHPARDPPQPARTSTCRGCAARASRRCRSIRPASVASSTPSPAHASPSGSSAPAPSARSPTRCSTSAARASAR